MFVCKVCGELCEEPMIRTVYEATRENPAEKEMCHCDCGGEFVEATKCEVCGEWFDNTELHGVCECCLEDYETVGEALEIGAKNLVSVDGINGAVASMLPVEQINAILIKFVEENFIDHSNAVVKYCEKDKGYFSEYLADKYGG